MKKGISLAAILIVILLTGCVNETQQTEDHPKTISDIESSTTKKTYTSPIYNLTLEHPDNWKLYEDETVLDIQPSDTFSNYFSLELLDGEFSQLKTLEDYIAARNLVKADFTIGGEDVYTEKDTLSYFLFSHSGKVYQIFTYFYELPEVQEIMKSVRFQ